MTQDLLVRLLNVEMDRIALVKVDVGLVLITEVLLSGTNNLCMQYSQELIEECKEVFKDEHGLDLTSETANEYLDSFARLFFIFAKDKEKVE